LFELKSFADYFKKALPFVGAVIFGFGMVALGIGSLMGIIYLHVFFWMNIVKASGGYLVLGIIFSWCFMVFSMHYFVRVREIHKFKKFLRKTSALPVRAGYEYKYVPNPAGGDDMMFDKGHIYFMGPNTRFECKKSGWAFNSIQKYCGKLNPGFQQRLWSN
jgi:hypothetical protein